jgi:hypothetical protein
MPRYHVTRVLVSTTLLALSPLVFSQPGASAADLIQKYTALAGSEDNAKSLVDGLRSGSEVKLSAAGSSGASFTPPTGKMGYGNISIALSLAEAQLKTYGISSPAPQQLQNTVMGLLQQRAEGKSWGQIANSIGVKLGEAVRSEK